MRSRMRSGSKRFAIRDPHGKLSLTKLARRQRRGGITPEFRVPVRPRPRIDDAGWRTIEGVAEVLIGHIAAENTHILMDSIRHRVRHETHRIGEDHFRRLEPDNPARDFFGLVVERDWFQRSRPHSLTAALLGRSSRSTARAAAAKRDFISSGNLRRSPSSKNESALRVICALNRGP